MTSSIVSHISRTSLWYRQWVRRNVTRVCPPAITTIDMRLASITISNYRSILNAHRLSVGSMTVLVGPNNEGKSNVLTATNLALDILANWQHRRHYLASRTSSIQYSTRDHVDYVWTRDYPMSRQADHPEGRSVVTLELELTPEEFSEFQRTIGINLSTNLRIKMGFGTRDVTYDILMKGRGKRSLNSKREEIASFIQSKVVYPYISAIRPANSAKNMIDRVLRRELDLLYSQTEYAEALKRLDDLEKPLLNSLGGRVYDTMRTFIPAVRCVTITGGEDRRRPVRRQFNLNIDDGTDTDLSLKGDGIISLTTMALVRHFASELSSTQSLVFAIEEPESHLHPDAIVQLKEVLKSIAEDSQVIITTHSPILVERTHVDHNIVVELGAAAKAKSIAQIRKTLGIRLSDNLVNAQLVILVEGVSDVTVLLSLLPKRSPTIAGALDRGQLIIESTTGAGKLSYYCQFHKQSLSSVHVFYDNDGPGRDQVEAALSAGTIRDSEYTLVRCPQMSNSELEDLFDVRTWLRPVNNTFGISAVASEFNGHQKWTDRVKRVLLSKGKVWTTATEKRLKTTVSEAVAEAGLSALSRTNSEPFENLVEVIERRIDGMA
jgi:putative ATP-dependent endonuclease of the OLD family